jgi:sulfite reductase (NADPH) flavoprotein alpha-component
MNELPRLIPDDAPFSPAQRAWLNGFLAGLFGPAQTPASEKAEDFPWHDPVLDMDERMALAEGRPLPRRLMAAMAQLDCGQCGYLCRTYAEAIAEGRESATSLCVPGGKPTQRALKQILAATPAAAPVADPPKAPAAAPAPKVRVVSAARLSGEGSAKDVRHIVIDLAGSGLEYEPGDSISIGVRHDPALVEATLAALHATGDEDFGGMTLREALASRLDIARPLDRTADLLAMCATDPSEAAALRALADGDDGAEPADADLLDLLHAFPSARPPLRDLARSLPTLKPRVYSIASSPRATPAQVHLCVDVVRAERRGRVRHGVGSSFLRRIAEDQGEVTASIVTSHFRLPAEPDRPIIIVGPGTGIAPFRAFLQHRAATGARGRTWLFCGGQHEASDFLFRDELHAWCADGTLSRLTTAFSRDQRDKIYVQHRMLENAAEIWRWLQDGACLYICGDASRMARDVDAALRRLARERGNMDDHGAGQWLASLARQGRYQRDVY